MGRAQVLLSGAAGALLALLAGYFVVKSGQDPDFVVFWSAHQVENPYIEAELREAISQVVQPAPANWPYPYPPTFLLLTAWFAILPFSAAYLSWIALTGGALAASCRHPASPLILLSPWVVFALMAGQTSVALGALILFGLTAKRPVVAGILLGIAGCIKPQFLFLVAAGLMFAAQWRTIAAMLATGAGLVLATAAAFGVEIWRDWLLSLPSVAAYSRTISPHLDLPGWPLKLTALAIGLALLWKAREPEERVIAAVGTSLLVMPHALWYNSAVLAPAILALFARQGWRMTPALATLAFFPNSLLVAFATAYPWFIKLLKKPAEGALGDQAATRWR
jgi:hypothetical protein